MGLSLRKLGRGIRKIARKNRGGFRRLVKKAGPGLVIGAINPAAPLIAKAASAAKTLGKKVRGVETPKSLVPVIRAATSSRKRTRTRMPGGAAIPTIRAPQVGMMRSTPQAKRSLYDSMPTRTKRQKRRHRKVVNSDKPYATMVNTARRKKRKSSSGKKRTPPKGGKDLKAIAAKWRAAGKPGKWIDFVKAN